MDKHSAISLSATIIIGGRETNNQAMNKLGIPFWKQEGNTLKSF